MRGDFAFVGEVGGEDDFFDGAVGGAVDEFFEVDLRGADAVERGQAAHEHEVEPAERTGLFKRDLIGRRFDDAEDGRVASFAGAQVAQRLFGERVAALAVTEFFERAFERFGEAARGVALVLHEFERDSLSSSRADAGELF